MGFTNNKGIVLVQVLLITSMLLIFVVQLSRDTQAQLKTALLLQTKAKQTLQASNSLEQLKFDLLTMDKLENGELTKSYQFNSVERTLSPNLKMSLQDEDGLVSLPYSTDLLEKLSSNGESLAKMVREWQGTADSVSANREIRDGLAPATKEFTLLGGWDKGIDLDLLTHLPTAYFNLPNMPEKLITKMFGVEKLEAIQSLKNSGGANQQDWQNVTGLQGDFLISKIPGKFIKVDFQLNIKDTMITKKYRLMLDFNVKPMIAEVAVE